MPAAAHRILVVDDERDMRYLTRAFLEHAFPGVLVSEAVDGASALALLARQRFDVVVSDYRMPGMDGFTLLSKAAPVPAGRCILMTAYADKALQARAHEAGFHYIEKAGDPENVVDAVRRLLARAGPPFEPFPQGQR
jgi:CheY-like chemotaxis protein